MSEIKTITIGRSRDCDIVFSDDNTVSRKHAELRFVGNGKMMLIDCKSTHGTRLIIDGKARTISQFLLSPTDVIEFGQKIVTAKELLELIRLKYPPLDGPGKDKPLEPETPKTPWVHGPRLQRCSYCAAIVVSGSRCKVCGR